MKLILKYLKNYKLLFFFNVISVFGFILVELGIPLRPSVPNSLPAMPGHPRMFSPTMATVARSHSSMISSISPMAISCANSRLSTSRACSASSRRTPIEVVFSLDACDTRNTLMPALASALNIR